MWIKYLRTGLGVAGILAVIGTAAFLSMRTEEPETIPEPELGPIRGIACPDIRAALDSYEDGDRIAFRAFVSNAAAVAEEALDTSGEVFGRPERLALELQAALRTEGHEAERVATLLTLAVDACDQLRD